MKSGPRQQILIDSLNVRLGLGAGARKYRKANPDETLWKGKSLEQERFNCSKAFTVEGE